MLVDLAVVAGSLGVLSELILGVGEQGGYFLQQPGSLLPFQVVADGGYVVQLARVQCFFLGQLHVLFLKRVVLLVQAFLQLGYPFESLQKLAYLVGLGLPYCLGHGPHLVVYLLKYHPFVA